MDVVYELPPRTVEPGVQLASTDVEAPLEGLWKLVDRFVKVKRNDEPLRAPPIRYAPENHARLLVATFDAAREAALRSDKSEYTRLMNVATMTLTDYFDLEAPLVGETLRETETLAGASLSAELPDITGSFALLEKLRRGNEEEEPAQ